MDTKFLKSLTAKMPKYDSLHYISLAIFVLSSLFVFYSGQLTTILLGAGVACILYALTSDIPVSLIAGAIAALIAVHYSRKRREGFQDVEEDFEEEDFEEEKKIAKKEKKDKKVKKAKKPAPDNGSRGEFFEPGKKYKIPSEKDDAEFHLDAGTTFMNAYKSLKPDQIAAMTKDTQELMNTQKQLMGTLQTLKPLIQDGKEMMNVFQSYFGAGQASLT